MHPENINQTYFIFIWGESGLGGLVISVENSVCAGSSLPRRTRWTMKSSEFLNIKLNGLKVRRRVLNYR